MRPLVLSLLLTALAPAMAAHANAQPAADARGSTWRGQVGVAVLSLPAYSGADESRLRTLPLVGVEYGDRYYLGESRAGLMFGAGMVVARRDALRWSVEVGGIQHRADRDAGALAGMDRDRMQPFVGTRAAYRLGPVEASASVATAMRRREGTLGELSLGSGLPLPGGWMLGASAGAELGDRRLLDARYGISSDEAARRRALLEAGDPRLRAGDDRTHAPRGGLESLSARFMLMRPLGSRATLVAFSRTSRLQGDAADSPLARRRTSGMGGAALVYRIGAR